MGNLIPMLTLWGIKTFIGDKKRPFFNPEISHKTKIFPHVNLMGYNFYPKIAHISETINPRLVLTPDLIPTT